MKFLSHPRVKTRISHTAKNRNCAVSLVRNVILLVTTPRFTIFYVCINLSNHIWYQYMFHYFYLSWSIGFVRNCLCVLNLMFFVSSLNLNYWSNVHIIWWLLVFYTLSDLSSVYVMWLLTVFHNPIALWIWPFDPLRQVKCCYHFALFPLSLVLYHASTFDRTGVTLYLLNWTILIRTPDLCYRLP